MTFARSHIADAKLIDNICRICASTRGSHFATVVATIKCHGDANTLAFQRMSLGGCPL